jgi:hypothetical protein
MALTLITFSPNTIIKSAEVNANFNALNGELFDIDQNNFNPGAQLPDSLLAVISTPGKINGQAVVAESIDAVKGQFTWTIAGSLAVGTSQSFPLRPSATALVVTSVFLEVTTAPTGAALIVDINKNGNTLFTTRPQIAAAALTGGSGAIFVANPTTLALDDKLTVDIDQVGSTIAGANIVVYLRCDQKVPQ